MLWASYQLEAIANRPWPPPTTFKLVVNTQVSIRLSTGRTSAPPCLSRLSQLQEVNHLDVTKILVEPVLDWCFGGTVALVGLSTGIYSIAFVEDGVEVDLSDAQKVKLTQAL